MDPLRPRRTHLGHVPSAWLRPRRRAVVVRFVVAALYCLVLMTMGSALEPLDMRVIYLPDDVGGILDAMGDAGRAEYRLFAFADLGFILVYSSLLMTWVSFLRVRDGLPKAMLPVFALAAGVFDVVETVGALVLLGQFPDLDRAWVIAVSLATPGKWIALLATIVILVWGEWTRWQRRHDPR